MGKGKLAKFADMAEYPHVFEYPYSVVDDVPFEMKGKWNKDFFKNDNPYWNWVAVAVNIPWDWHDVMPTKTLSE